MFRIAVLTSGMSRGSNLKAIALFFKREGLPIEIKNVIITKEKAPVVSVCNELNISCKYIRYSLQSDFENQLLEIVYNDGIQLIAMAGFLKKLSPTFIRESNIPILNIHPALLPDFGGNGMYGQAVHESVFKAHKKESGVTVHLVDAKYDHGKIIRQQTVDISNCQSAQEIANKVLLIEHMIYGETIWNYLSDIYS